MSSPATERARADLARARFHATAGELRDRLSPSTLADDARGESLRFARTKPGLAAGLAGGLVVLLIRKPLGRLLFGKRRKKKRARIKAAAVARLAAATAAQLAAANATAAQAAGSYDTGALPPPERI